MQARLARAGLAVERVEVSHLRTLAATLAALAVDPDIAPTLKATVTSVVREWSAGWYDRLNTQLDRLILREDAIARRLAPKAVRPIKRISVVRSAPLDGLTAKEWIDKTAAALRDQTLRDSRLARLRGQLSDRRSGEIRRTLQRRARHHVRGVSRMAATGAVNQTHRRVWKQSGATYVLFNAIIDGRTSAPCRAASGRRWRIDDPGILVPPLHPGCRSFHSPVYGEGVKTPIDYDRWFRSKSAAYQDEILGKARGKLYREGWTLRDMLRPDGVTMKTVASRELALAR